MKKNLQEKIEEIVIKNYHEGGFDGECPAKNILSLISKEVLKCLPKEKNLEECFNEDLDDPATAHNGAIKNMRNKLKKLLGG